MGRKYTISQRRAMSGQHRPALRAPPMLGPEEIGRSSPALGFLRQSRLTQGRCRLAMCRGGGGGRFRAPVREFFMSSSVVGRRPLVQYGGPTTTGFGWGYWDIGRRLLSALMVFCVTTSRIVLYSTIHTVPCLPTMIERSSPSAIPGTKSLSLSISCHKRQSRTRRVARQNRGCIRTGWMQAHNRVFFVPITVIEL